MKRTICYILFCLLLPVALLAQQKAYTIDEVPNVRSANRTFYVSDPEKILNQETTDSINAMLYQLEVKTGIQSAVVVLPSIGDETPFDFAYSLGRRWGVGKKNKDTGLVVLLVIDQRKIQFATGYGLEGDLTDAVCKRIQTSAMVPAFKQNDWNTGMRQGVKMLCGKLDGSMSDEADFGDNLDDGTMVMVVLFVFLFVGGGIFLILYKNFMSNRCPNCKKHELSRVNSQVMSRRGGVKIEMVTYRCRNCGHEIQREIKSYDENYRGRGFGGPFIGGGGFSSGGGGGFSGGSFGGGSFGGGGAGSGF
jgi:uncharacterized protein